MNIYKISKRLYKPIVNQQDFVYRMIGLKNLVNTKYNAKELNSLCSFISSTIKSTAYFNKSLFR